MAEKKKKDDYFARGLQKIGYNLGLVDNPDVSAVRKEAYKGYTPKKKPAPKAAAKAPDKGGHRITYGESTNASAMDRAATDAARARLPKAKAAGTGKGNPKTVNSFKKVEQPKSKPSYAERRTAMKEVLEGYRAEKKTPATTPAAPDKKPVSNAPRPTARPSMKKGSSSPPAYTPDKPQKRGNVTSGFSGNWVGAAPTEMQKRGGARINPGGGLLGKLRKK